MREDIEDISEASTGSHESGPTAADLELLRECIALSWHAKEAGRHPFAAIVVDGNGGTLSRCVNNAVPPEGNPTQHAELRAAAEASSAVPLHELAAATLYTSAEPCAMCTGAIYWTGIGRVVYALSESELLGLTGDNAQNPTLALPCREVLSRGQRHIRVVGPLLEQEAAAPHVGYWR